MHIPLNDLQAQFQSIKSEVMASLERVLDSMQLFLGPQSLQFEQSFASYCSCDYGIGVSNGTDAIALALLACHIGPGDEVITVSHSFIATVEAIAQVGATPVFVDIEPDTYTMDWRQLEGALSEHTRAIIPVHLYGHPADMQPIMEFAQAHGLRVIEDASQAHGAIYQGKRVGSFGDIGCFSLYCSKNLGAYGEAGVCVTNNEELAETLRMLRDHGSRVRYQHELLGMNGRLDEMQAAILNVKMPRLQGWNAQRQAHAQAYSAQLQDVVEQIPTVRPQASHVFYVYVVQVSEREQVRKHLEQRGIASGIHYPVPIHLQLACQQYGYTRGMFPVTEAVCERIISLPMYPELTPQQVQAVIDGVKQSVLTSVVS
ncbi:MAG TPA: DegT/DnrJ/EryC1/StrS family aminotransferase [Ktedonobacteraceae bacterium]|nr:DegT/DnrJ/EryC1/StrS family aminotransferase [Ktedonobacteraceae bacterium]